MIRRAPGFGTGLPPGHNAARRPVRSAGPAPAGSFASRVREATAVQAFVTA